MTDTHNTEPDLTTTEAATALSVRGMTDTHTTDLELLTTTEAATALRVDPATIRRMIAAGDLPAVRVGRAYRVERAQLTAYTDRHRTSRPIVVNPVTGA